MFDLILTLLAIFGAYKGYQWYQGVQNQVKSGPQAPPQVGFDDNGEDPGTAQPGDEDDYIEYEEV